MPVEPITHLEKTIAGMVEPVTHLEKVIDQYGGGGGGGAVSSVNGKTGNVTLYADDVGAAPAETVVEVSGTTPTITPAANTVYEYGELTSLTISNPPATGSYSIVFTSGATATTTTFPATILGLEDFAAEANTIYEINVLDNRAVVGSWEVSA
jgi:hypothetical protein